VNGPEIIQIWFNQRGFLKMTGLSAKKHILGYFKLDAMLEIMEPHGLDVALLIYHTWTCAQSNGNIASQITDGKHTIKSMNQLMNHTIELIDSLIETNGTNKKRQLAVKEPSNSEENFIEFCEHRLGDGAELNNNDAIVYNLILYSRYGGYVHLQLVQERIMYIINDIVCEWSRNNTDMI